MSKPIKQIIFCLAVVVTGLFGLTGIWIGGSEALEFMNLSAKTIAYYGISLVAGLALLVSSLLSLRQSWRQTMALGGLVAATVLVLNHFLGLEFQALLCFTPS